MIEYGLFVEIDQFALVVQWPEIALHAAHRANTALNVVLFAKSCPGIDWRSFNKCGPDCVELRLFSLMAGCMQKFDNGTVETSHELIGFD